MTLSSQQGDSRKELEYGSRLSVSNRETQVYVMLKTCLPQIEIKKFSDQDKFI